MPNEAATGGHPGPAKADAFVFLGPQAAKGRTHEDPPGRAPRRSRARAPGQPPSSPSPRPPTARPQTGRRSPAGRVRPGGWGELCRHLDAQVAPPPLVRRDLGPPARADLSRRRDPVGVPPRWERGPRPEQPDTHLIGSASRPAGAQRATAGPRARPARLHPHSAGRRAGNSLDSTTEAEDGTSSPAPDRPAGIGAPSANLIRAQPRRAP